MEPAFFCCESFKQCVDNAGNEGFAAIPKEFGPLLNLEFRTRFTLQSRIFRGTYIHTAESGMCFCPWCGYDLDRFIADNPEMILKLAHEKKHLLIGEPNYDRPVFFTLGNTEPFEHKKRNE